MNRYQKMEKLGEGGQGKVYKVRRREDGKVLVLKMVNCTGEVHLKHAKTEVAVMKGLHHPHLVTLNDHFVYKGTSHRYVCMVMPYYPNGDLFGKFSRMKKRNERFEESTLTRYTIQICSGLQYLHEADSWHRDIKTSNILLDEQNNLKLADFGLSATYSTQGHKTVVGTPYYFAPEVMLHEKYTNKVDIWNVGVLLLELVTLKQQPINIEVLCENKDVNQKILDTVKGRGYSRQLGLVIASMLSRTPSERPSAREVLQQLVRSENDSLLLGETSPEARDLLRQKLTQLNLKTSSTQPPVGKKRSPGTTTTTTTTAASSGSSGSPLTTGSKDSAGSARGELENNMRTKRGSGNTTGRALGKDELILLRDKLGKLAGQ